MNGINESELTSMFTLAGIAILKSWRKRVISINWEATTIRTIVTDDEVTKGEDHVHAYGTLKAVEYLTTLNAMATAVATTEETT